MADSRIKSQFPAPGAGKTLVFCPIGLGNFIMATPALRLLSEGLGREHLDLLALKPGIAAMARASGFFGQVHAWDPDKEGLGRGLGVLRAIRREGYACSLSLFPTGHWKFTLFAWLAGARRRLGFRYPHSRLPGLVQNESLDLDPRLHDTDQNLRLAARALGLPEAAGGPQAFPHGPGHPRAGELAARAYFVCHPGSSAERGMAGKRLPPEAFAALIRNLHQEFGWSCILIGGPEEEGLRASVAALAPEAVWPVETRSLDELGTVIAGARFFLGNDSGLMHMAAALGLPCIAFFGPTDEGRTGPYPAGRHLVLRRRDLACAPCWSMKTIGRNPPCIYGDTRCLKDFPAEAAWGDIRAFVSALAAGAP